MLVTLTDRGVLVSFSEDRFAERLSDVNKLKAADKRCETTEGSDRPLFSSVQTAVVAVCRHLSVVVNKIVQADGLGLLLPGAMPVF